MTLSQLFMPRVESRPPASAERSSVAKSAEEGSNRFFEEALQRAETRKSTLNAEREESRAEASRSRAEDADREAMRDAEETSEAADAREAGQARKSQESQTSDTEAAKSDETPVVADAEATEPAVTVGEKRLQELANANGKGRPTRKKGEELAWLAMPHAALLAANATMNAPVMTAGEAQSHPQAALSANIPSQGGQPGMSMPPVGEAVTNPAQPGQPSLDALLSGNPARGLAETLGSRTQARADLNLPASLTPADEKNDFAMAMRLVSDGARGVGEKPGVTSGNTLSPQSPAFGDELAEEVGRMRFISRAGGAEQMRISLNPRELGNLDLRVAVDGDQRVHVMITAESDATRDLLNKQIPQLREALARQNLGMGEVMVHVDDGRGGDAAAQWGFQGGHGATEERREGLAWRASGRGQAENPAPPVEGVGPAPVASGGASGLSLFA
ncbi:MAG: flagellar hook-length control protein FliK [Magnetococcales bacterium]|nr:flagellar hook-length control protein FliK [Magnetococcales bacterium]